MRFIHVIFAAFWAVFLLAGPAHAGPVAGFFTAIAAAAKASAVVAALIQIVGSVALSALAQALLPKPRSGGIQTDTTQEGGTQSQSFIVGTYATAGTRIAPRMTFDKSHREMRDVIQLSDLPITAISRIAINGAYRDMTPDVTHAGYTWDYSGELYAADVYYGNQTAAAANLMLNYSGAVERPWQSDMIGRDMAYVVMSYYFDQEKHSGWPEALFEVQGIRLYDVRKDSTAGGSGAHRWTNPATWEWSENPCVIIYNILRGIALPDGRVWGGECTSDDLPLSVWAAAMNKCDEAVPLAAGGTVPRYRCGFEIKVGEDEPIEIIEELLKSCSGSIVEIGGVYKVRAGGPGLPVYFFSDDELLVTSGHVFTPFAGLAETFNTIYATYPEPGQKWESHDAPERSDAAYVTEDQGRILPVNVTLPCVPYAGQVQRLMRAWLKDNRRWRRHTIALGHYAAGVEPLDTVAWTSEDNGYTVKNFEVAQVVESADLVQQWELREVDPTDYDWSTSDELPTYVPSVLPDAPVNWPVPNWSVSPAVVQDGAGRDRRAGLRFQWTGADVSANAILVQIRVQGLTNTWTYTIADVDAGDVIYSQGILPEVTYEARARLRQPGPTEWTPWLAATTAELRLGPQDLPSTDYQSLLTDSAMASGEPGSQGSVWGKLGSYDTYCLYGEQASFPLLAGIEIAKYAVRVSAVPASATWAGINTRGDANRFEAEPGERFRISMRVWVNTGGTAIMRCAVSWRNAAGDEIVAALGSQFTLTTTGQWLTVTADLVAPAGAVWGIPRFYRIGNDTNSGYCFIARPRVMRRNFDDVTSDGDVSLEWSSYDAAWVQMSGNSAETTIDLMTLSDSDAGKIIGKSAFLTFTAQVGLERTGSAGRARGVVIFEAGGSELGRMNVQHRVAVNEEIQFPITFTRKVTVPFALPLTFVVRAASENDATGAGNVFRLRYRRLEVTAVRK